MNIRFLIMWLALGMLAAGGCAEGPKVLTDFDPSAEFSAFRTFAFSGITDRGYEVVVLDTSPLRRRIKEMVDEQLAAKGLRRVSLDDRPDLLVHLFFGVKDQQRVQSTGKAPGFYGPHATTYEYHDGDWVPVKSRGKTTYEDHEGALIVDLAESSKKKLVWRAVIRAVLGDSLEKNFEMANKGIAEAFKDYPSAKK
jgi:hypothetical protein